MPWLLGGALVIAGLSLVNQTIDEVGDTSRNALLPLALAGVAAYALYSANKRR